MEHGGNQNLLALVPILAMPSHPPDSIYWFSQEEKGEIKGGGYWEWNASSLPDVLS